MRSLWAFFLSNAVINSSKILMLRLFIMWKATEGHPSHALQLFKMVVTILQLTPFSVIFYYRDGNYVSSLPVAYLSSLVAQ